MTVRHTQWVLAILMATVWTVRVVIWGVRMIMVVKNGHHGM